MHVGFKVELPGFAGQHFTESPAFLWGQATLKLGKKMSWNSNANISMQNCLFLSLCSSRDLYKLTTMINVHI